MNLSVSKSRLAAVALGATCVSAGIMAPGASAYSGATAACQGASIVGGGASLQKAAQAGWGADTLASSPFTLGSTPFGSFAATASAVDGFGFTTPTGAATTCSNLRADGKTVGYTSVGSGAGRNSWAADGIASHRDATAAFIGSDEAPSPAEEANIESLGLTAATTVETIPVAQAAVAIIVNLPAGCKLSAAVGKRQALLTQLEKVEFGAQSKWGNLMGSSALTPSTCAQQPVTRIVRKDSSGSTFAFKKVLDKVDGHWHTGATDYTAPANNTLWPSAVTAPAGTGGGAVADLVNATAGSIGYVDLATARTKGFSFDGTTNDTTFWLSLTAPANPSTGLLTVTNDPAKDVRPLGTTGLSRGAYCSPAAAGRDYLAAPGSPTSTQDNWFNVTAAQDTYGKYEYPICTLTYVLAYDKYRNFPGITEPQARTAYDYVKYMTSTDAQVRLAASDYMPLPSNGLHPLRPIASSGANRVNW